jgi:hypothetical protein
MFLRKWNRLAVFAGVIQFTDFLLERGKRGLVLLGDARRKAALEKRDRDNNKRTPDRVASNGPRRNLRF